MKPFPNTYTLTKHTAELKVVELRKLCSEAGKSGYKSLKKQQLIELLMN